MASLDRPDLSCVLDWSEDDPRVGWIQAWSPLSRIQRGISMGRRSRNARAPRKVSGTEIFAEDVVGRLLRLGCA